MTASGENVATGSGVRVGRRAWFALAVLLLPITLVAIDATVLGFAVPHLSEDLEPTGSQLLWIVDIYSFLLAGLLVTMGTLGDRVGRRRLLMIGSAGFGVASVLASYSTSPEMLIAARALLGLTGATLMPSSLSLIRNIFPDGRQRRLAIAVWVTTWSVGAALGPVIGGWLLQHFWWGSVFLLNPPVVVLVLLLAPLLIPESRDPDPGRFDLVSVGQSLAAMLPVVYGLKTLALDGVSFVAVAAVVVGIGWGTAFVRRQRRLSHPLLDLRLFAGRGFSVSVVTNLVVTFVFFGALFFTSQYLQIVLGLTPVEAGLVLVPGSVLTIVTGLVVVVLVRQYSVASLISGGMLMVAVGYVLTTQLTGDSGASLIVVAFMLAGAGFGMVDTLTIDIIVTAAPANKAGAASAVSETAYEVGAALGIAVLGSVLTAVYAARLESVPGVPDAATEQARETIGGAVTVAADLGGSGGEALLAAAESAFVEATHVVGVVGAVVAAGAAVQAWFALRRLPRPE